LLGSVDSWITQSREVSPDCVVTELASDGLSDDWDDLEVKRCGVDRWVFEYEYGLTASPSKGVRDRFNHSLFGIRIEVL